MIPAILAASTTFLLGLALGIRRPPRIRLGSHAELGWDDSVSWGRVRMVSWSSADRCYVVWIEREGGT